jgi:hypothetical protein
VDPPTKSWAIYDSLDRGQVRYYELHLDAGDRLELSTFTPDGSAFTPWMVVMSPAIDADDDVPDRVTVPEGYGTLVVEGERPADASYEANTPAAIYETTSHERTVEEGGRYLVAVYEPAGRAGQVGFVAGDRESFTAEQYLTVAVDLPRVYLWEGDHPLVVFGPPLVVLVAGLAYVRRRVSSLDAPGVRYAMAAAGLLVAGSAVTVSLQMVDTLASTGPSSGAVITGVFVAIPLVLGGLLVRLSVSSRLDLSPSGRALLAVAGLGSLATWAGYLIAPLVPLALALWPGDPFAERGR